MKAGIVGANGYGGAELIRFLNQHPYADIELLISHSTSGKKISEQYPHLRGLAEWDIEDLHQEGITDRVEVLFFATPAGVTKEVLPSFLEKGIKCIDLSGDFRLKDSESYRKWYGKTPAKEEHLKSAVYGLPELNRDSIKTAELIANPGCYPTAAILGMKPAIQASIVEAKTIIIDAKSGISGAGRSPSMGNLFSEVNENIQAYKLCRHQHIPEIEQAFHELSGKDVAIMFTPHLIPMTRGIMCTMYADLTREMTAAEIHELYKETYKDELFIRVRPLGEIPATKEVYGSNYCDIGLSVDQRTNKLIIISVIDNLVKGAAGQAIQNMNLLGGWNEQTGIHHTPVYP
ncbi:N-acetyl-gamma-glutamyl-phosphate reductase [Heyndrickxia acidicola]|uniref:N-acetyl-gamma-glutamyl-phosphate reductase n=1 Tax=Heyndrickxia acidicola TaxID=209389 RepID=A0ABU6MJ68_9BACI|nr:N-acetyl-gamma-glutamyl-phosphate reductase [Heyndrickxia acidicola]MED1204051.1 N-acetyl-gamma-glutamyl-phosphate reductase [Heyndrickxia acidicola]